MLWFVIHNVILYINKLWSQRKAIRTVVLRYVTGYLPFHELSV